MAERFSPQPSALDRLSPFSFSVVIAHDLIINEPAAIVRIMIVRITANLTDPTAQELYRKFHAEGYAPWGSDEILMGFVRDAVLTPEKYLITVDVTNPQAIDYIFSLPRGKA